jgi:hypothetical protein
VVVVVRGLAAVLLLVAVLVVLKMLRRCWC